MICSSLNLDLFMSIILHKIGTPSCFHQPLSWREGIGACYQGWIGRTATHGYPEKDVKGVPASERARRSMQIHKVTGGGDKHWRLSRRAMAALEHIMATSLAKTEQSVIERLLIAERKRLEVQR